MTLSVPPVAKVKHGPPVGRSRPAAVRGFTIVELLVAATLALVVMAALTSLFGIFGRAVADSQELIQLTARMRSAAWTLRQDLQGLTTDVEPLVRPDAACGYLEIVEGPLVETGVTTVADVDDILMLTTAGPGRPFTGLLSGTLGYESPAAEVAWFCKLGPQSSDGLQLYNLYRRQLLVAAAPGAGTMQATSTEAFATWGTWDAFYQSNDLSVRREGALLIPNSLADLTRRQSRFMRNLAGTTNPPVRSTWPTIMATGSATASGTSEVLTGAREGEDLLLTNVIAFDVRVFDSQRQANGAFGAYVNLGDGGGTVLGGPGAAIPFTGMPAGSRVYDTWSLHTEFNNVADSAVVVDRGTNLADDNGNGVVDDAGELEQPPPYTVPLRGVEIRIRCYDPSSQEVRQITVQHSFLAR